MDLDKYARQLLQSLREKRKTYLDMVQFCADSWILNNVLISELAQKGFEFFPFCGSEITYEDKDGNEIPENEAIERINNGEDIYENYDDIFQYFIIDSEAAERFCSYTNELVLYNEELDLYLLCVKHFGTAWDYVPANWKEIENETM